MTPKTVLLEISATQSMFEKPVLVLVKAGHEKAKKRLPWKTGGTQGSPLRKLPLPVRRAD
jgi:hypothetical protein